MSTIPTEPKDAGPAIKICTGCGVEFSDRRDMTIRRAFGEPDEIYCSETCAINVGFFELDASPGRTGAVLRELKTVVKSVRPNPVFPDYEIPSLNDTLAILNLETGAARKEGPPVTLPLILDALNKREAEGWFRGDDYAFWSDTLARLQETMAMLKNDDQVTTRSPHSTVETK